jgi:error-prone DNA polymerase
MIYAELHAHSYFSLLDGASAPEALAAQAAELGLAGLALTDHDSLAGAVRFWNAARRAGLPAIVGAEVTLEDDTHLTLLAETQAGYANLCRLISASRLDWLPPITEPAPPAEPDTASSPLSIGASQFLSSPWPGKVPARLAWARLAAHAQGLIFLSGCRRGAVASALLRGEEAAAERALGRLCEIAGAGSLFVELQHHALPDDDRLVRRLLALARGCQLPVVATHNVHYADRSDSMLRDALIAVRHNETLTAARQAGHLPLNSDYALPAPAEMVRRFAQCPAALANTLAIAERCQVSLDFSHQRLPRPPAGWQIPDVLRSTVRSSLEPTGSAVSPAPFPLLYQLCHASLPRCYPDLRPAVLKQLAHELEVIEQAGLAGYFLTVWDIVRFAASRGIRCQGRGSAANSIVAYLLGITRVDPLRHNLLFERFLSADKFTMPDIDIDFAADRREEVIQYVYARYGRSHTAMVCNVVTYQARSALRDLGKALDLSEETIARIGHRLDTNSPAKAAEAVEEQLTIVNCQLSIINCLTDLLRRIDGCPRHLAIHSGGMLITGAPLDEIVPLEPATMPGRVVCQWDKDSVEDAGLIKIDLLALRTLGMVSEALEYIAQATGAMPDLDTLPLDDPELYDMLQRADTIGAFQVESRAQQQMLPRLRPACFEDIAVEVAIVRPGPIQGGAVHPYLRRRAGLEPVEYLHPTLEPVLRETLGVLLFQEQAVRVAVAAAGFTPGEADLLRRALGRARTPEDLAPLRVRFLRGAAERGIVEETAAAIFGQLAGFAGYGFCKSHAASFALIAYQTLWLKRYHPAAFYCALLNQQPMGFYPPEVILGDARRHGVETLPPDVNRSGWLYTVAGGNLRTGLHVVAEFGEQAWVRLAAARQESSFAGLEDFCRRAQLPRDAVSNLIRAGALDGFGARRSLLWRLGELDYRPEELELETAPTAAALPELAAAEQTAWEYELMGLAPGRQLMAHYRAGLRRRGVWSVWQVKQAEAGRRVRVAGFVVVRQRPATAQGILFMSLEDESGLLDLVVKPEVYVRLREVIRAHPLLEVVGVVQRGGQAVSVLVWEANGFSAPAATNE